MSLRAMTWATELRGLSAAQFRILLVLAHHHNHVTHQCNPSQDTLAEECEISLRSVQSHLLVLEEKELIRRERIAGNMGQCAGTNYTLAIDFDQPANFAGRENMSEKTPIQPAKSGASNPQLIACGNEQGKEPIPPLSPHEDIGYRRPHRTPRTSRHPKGRRQALTEDDWRMRLRIAKFKGYWLPEWGETPDKHPDAPEACKREWQSWKSEQRVDPALRGKVAQIMGEGFCASYLDPCEMTNDGALVSATSIAYDRLRVCKPLQGIRVLPPVVKVGALETGRR